MSLEIQFAFVCQRQFAELSGDGDFKRFCDICERAVINLDPLDDQSRLRVFQEAKSTGTVPCVSSTIPIPGNQECSGSLPSVPRPPLENRPTAGMPVWPGNFEEEQQRLARLSEIKENQGQSWTERLIGRFKFWGGAE